MLIFTLSGPVLQFTIETPKGPAKIDLQLGKNMMFISLDFKHDNKPYQLLIRATVEDDELVFDAMPQREEPTAWYDRTGWLVAEMQKDAPARYLTKQPPVTFFQNVVLKTLTIVQEWYSTHRKIVSSWKRSWNWRLH